MLPELIYREEHLENYPMLVLLGALSAFIGFGAANVLFPTQVDLLTVIFASIPLVYPLTAFFLEDEEENRPHSPEVLSYGSMFLGEVIAFTSLGYLFPEQFSLQVLQFESQLLQMGITGYATNTVSFAGIFLNNLTVFMFIFIAAALIGSAGAFILTWNASVLGVFIGVLLRELPKTLEGLLIGTEKIPSPVGYVPHAAFEMTGFIIAGIAGSLISAAVYRRHFDRETWKDYGKLVALGIVLLLVGATLETA